jgi:hypothetical protein
MIEKSRAIGNSAGRNDMERNPMISPIVLRLTPCTRTNSVRRRAWKRSMIKINTRRPKINPGSISKKIY